MGVNDAAWQMDSQSGLAKILQGYQQGSQFKQQKQQNELNMTEQRNQDREKTGQFGLENLVNPQYQGDAFTGYAPNVNPQQQEFAQKMLDRQEGGGLNPIYRRAPRPIGAPQQTTPSGRPLGQAPQDDYESTHDPITGQPYPQQPAPTVGDAVHAAAAPSQDPGAPPPAIRDPKIAHEIAKATVANAQNQQPQPGQAIGTQLDANSNGGVRYAPQPPVKEQGAEIPVSAAPRAPMDPYMAKRLIDFGTTQQHYNFDPPVNIATLPLSVRKGAGINVDEDGNDIPDAPDQWMPTSIAKAVLSGEYGNQKSNITARGKFMTPDEEKLVAGVTGGSMSMGNAISEWAQKHPGQMMTPAVQRGLMQAVKANQASQNIDLRSFGTTQRALTEPLFRTYQQRINGAQNILGMLNNIQSGKAGPDKIAATQQVLNQIQQEQFRLEQGAQVVGEHTAEGMEMKDYAAHISSIYDSLSGAVTPVDLEPKLNQSRAIIGFMVNEYKQRALDRFDAMGSGAPSGRLQNQFSAKRQELVDQYFPEIKDPNAGNPQNGRGRAPRPTPVAPHGGSSAPPVSHAPGAQGAQAPNTDASKQYADAVKALNTDPKYSKYTPEQKKQIISGWRQKLYQGGSK